MGRRWFGAVLACAVVATQPAAADTAATWLRKPTPQDLVSVWPVEAWRKGLGGKAVIGCTVSLQGALFDCVVRHEEPQGAGFGGAAIALTPQLRMRPATHDGQPVAGSVNIPIHFNARGGSGGPDLAPSDRILTGVAWREAPSYADVVAAYPPKARANAIGGQVMLDCAFREDGRLKDCSAAAESPKSLGFAAVARALSSKFAGPTALPDGSQTKGMHVHIPMTFAAEMLTQAKPTIGKAQWVALPTAAEFQAVFPKAASEAGVLQANVLLRCGVAPNGGLVDCAVVSEEPAIYGFGAATLPLTTGFRLNIWSAEGLPVIGGTIRAPIRFDLKPATGPPAKP
jgi:TonB family protein